MVPNNIEEFEDEDFQAEKYDMEFNLNRFVFDVQPGFEVNEFIADLFDFHYNNVNLTLLYRATRDGYMKNIFQEKLNKKNKLIFFFNTGVDIYGWYMDC